MEISKVQLTNFIKRIESSMKYQDLSALTPNQLIEKYENLLCEREKQIRDLSAQMGLINEKLFDAVDKYKSLINDNNQMDEKTDKTSKRLISENENKKIMSQRIANLIKENSLLRGNIKDNISNNITNKYHKRGGSVARNTKSSNILDFDINSNDDINFSNTQVLLSENINYVPVFK